MMDGKLNQFLLAYPSLFCHSWKYQKGTEKIVLAEWWAKKGKYWLTNGVSFALLQTQG
jgi:hypothetical protein